MSRPNKKIFSKVWGWRLAFFLWLGVIFTFSSIPDFKSNFPAPVDFVLRKLAHMTEYAVLFLLGWPAWQINWQPRRILGLLVFVVLYAISDEIHQSFVDLRNSSWRDVGIDTFGSFLAWGFLRYLK